MRKRLLSPFRSENPFVRVIAYLVLGFGIAIPAVFMTLFAIFALGGFPLPFEDDNCNTQRSVEGLAEIKLPPSATNLASACGGLQGIWAEAYFDMKPSDLAVFVNSTNVKLPLSTTDKPEKLECYPCNDLTSLKSYLYGTYSAEECFEEIFIDTSNPAQYRVYFTLLAG